MVEAGTEVSLPEKEVPGSLHNAVIFLGSYRLPAGKGRKKGARARARASSQYGYLLSRYGVPHNLRLQVTG
jgi:hypothetical protein